MASHGADGLLTTPYHPCYGLSDTARVAGYDVLLAMDSMWGHVLESTRLSRHVGAWYTWCVRASWSQEASFGDAVQRDTACVARQTSVRLWRVRLVGMMVLGNT
jgi:hypothetical protein